ncbi:hypothetical protein GIB67_026137, partial [Kingdonia uniflora]
WKYKLTGGRRCDSNSTGPPCTGWVEMMAPAFSREAWHCMWYMIQRLQAKNNTAKKVGSINPTEPHSDSRGKSSSTVVKGAQLGRTR